MFSPRSFFMTLQKARRTMKGRIMVPMIRAQSTAKLILEEAYNRNKAML